MKKIIGIQVGNRESEALKVQELLTKNGCIIKTRLGLHESSDDLFSTSGLIILEFLSGSDTESEILEKELSTLSSVVVRKMEF